MNKENRLNESEYSSFQITERKFAGVAWISVLIIYWMYTHTHNLTAMEVVRRLIEFLAGNPLGFSFYVFLYMVRPLFLFPATIATMAAGYLYGPAIGIGYAVIASNLSSLIAYLIGRYFGSGLTNRFFKYDLMNRYAERLRRNSFETSLTLRFLFLPYDLVSYFSGFLKIGWRGFLLATILGSIPGTISFSLIGAALEGEFISPTASINVHLLMASALMFVVSMGLSRWFRYHEAKKYKLKEYS